MFQLNKLATLFMTTDYITKLIKSSITVKRIKERIFQVD